jgi:hypothetical protein
VSVTVNEAGLAAWLTEMVAVIGIVYSPYAGVVFTATCASAL